MNNFFKFTVAAALATLASGCSYATKSELAVVETNAQRARDTAVEAVVTAIAANKLATEAVAQAKSAQSAADAAAACCVEQKGRLDSMFEKAMRK